MLPSLPPALRKPACLAAIAAALLLFFIANRGAYQGYFSDDDLDNIAWTGQVGAAPFLTGLLSPEYFPNHFRPIGHGTFHILALTAGLDFPWYVAFIHLLHLANVTLVFLLARRLGLDRWPAAAAALFFLFPMAVFDALWKPMFLFDLYCASFCLLSALAWVRGRWIVSLLLFWLAYKSKEHAVMLPVVLAGYEYWLGKCRWKPLVPFFVIAASFGLQGVLRNGETGADYNLHFTPAALWQTSTFYLARILLKPWAALLLLFVPLSRDRRAWFGAAAAAAMLVPLLILPNRLFGAYLYVPLVWLAIAVGAVVQRYPWPATAAFFLLWLPLNYQAMRDDRRAALTIAQENQAYVSQLRGLPATMPGVRRFVYDGYPQGLRWWGISGALRYLYHSGSIELHAVDEQNLSEVFRAGGVALLSWDPVTRRLGTIARAPDEPDQSYIQMSRLTPIWQLEDGWYQLENNYRWTMPRATAHLRRPDRAARFEITVNIGPNYIRDVKQSTVHVSIDGAEAGIVRFTEQGWQTRTIDLAPAPAATVKVELRTEPEYRPSRTDPRALGIAVGAFGFPNSAHPRYTASETP